MSLTAEINGQRKGKGPQCHMGIVEAGLNKRDLAELREALRDTSVPTSAIYRALKARGHEVNMPGVGRHRRGDCKCGGTA